MADKNNSSRFREETVSNIFTYDTNLNVKEKEDPSAWNTFVIPFTENCCLKIISIRVEYMDTYQVDNMSGFFSMKTPKAQVGQTVNTDGKFEIIEKNNVVKSPKEIHVPVASPGTDNPKPLGSIPIKFSNNGTEIKFCLSDASRVPIKLKRGVFVFELTRKEKRLNFENH